MKKRISEQKRPPLERIDVVRAEFAERNRLGARASLR